jgi:hypothetical protein
MNMSATPLAPNQSPPAPPVDLEAVKVRQQGAWSYGDYAVVGTTLQIVGESLCEALTGVTWGGGHPARTR